MLPGLAAAAMIDAEEALGSGVIVSDRDAVNGRDDAESSEDTVASSDVAVDVYVDDDAEEEADRPPAARSCSLAATWPPV